jgi:hypothetical protein
MVAITPTKFNCFVGDLGLAKHNLNTDALKLVLSNTAPSLSNTVLTDITQITTGNGYSGPIALTSQSYSQSSGVGILLAADLTIAASGGNIAAFRYVVLYNDTASGDPLIQYWDLGSALTIVNGVTETIDLDGTNGLLKIGA